ncbi:hypothetical protein [Halopseudomonas sabulinigri]|uniref:hypothetical protein n=1 Tax=Halopseudomonas sabulinigri TaxID=472181 RepID=UPI0012FD6783|nr:hypothetical protein [Halopseudomonas sabulinigri]
MAVQFVFAVFILTNGIIVLVSSIRAKIIVISTSVLANFICLLPQHLLRALLFAILSGSLSLAAVNVALRLAPGGTSAVKH